MATLKEAFEKAMKETTSPKTRSKATDKKAVNDCLKRFKNEAVEDYLKRMIYKGFTAHDTRMQLGLTPAQFTMLCKQATGKTYEKLRKETGKPNMKRNLINDYGGVEYLIQAKKEGKRVTDIQKEMGLNSPSSIYHYLEKRGLRWKNL